MKKVLKPLYGDSENLMHKNPDRGYFTQSNLNVSGIEQHNMAGGVTFPTFGEIGHNMEPCYKDNINEDSTLQKIYVVLAGYDNRDIDQKGLDRIQKIFDFARERSLKLIFRPTYRNSYDDFDGNGSANTATIIRHLNQLKPILEKNKDILLVCEAGLLGTCGEFWDANLSNSWLGETYDEGAILKAYLNIIPEGIFMNVRQPKHWYNNVSAETSDNRIGFYNDAIFGNRIVNKGEDTIVPDKEGWKIVCEKSPYAISGGEMYWGEWLYTEGSDGQWRADDPLTREWVDGYDLIEQAVQHHFTYLSATNNNCGYNGMIFSMDRWKTTDITPEWCEKNKVLYEPEFFQKADGSKLFRNVYEFVKSYLGYRITAKEFELCGDINVNEEIKVKIILENHGFARPYNLESGFAILDKNDNVVSEVLAGNSGDWQPWDPIAGTRGIALEHSVSAKLKLSGDINGCKIAFFLRNSAGSYAKLANDITVVNGYHILTEI